MAGETLRVVVAVAPDVPRFRVAWRDLEPVLRGAGGLEIVAVDGGELDYSTVTAEMAVVIGGDGAILRACRHMGRYQLPILGVNVGRLGFLADLTTDQFLAALPQIVARQYEVRRHLMFTCVHTRQDAGQQEMLGLNEAVISSAASMRMIEVHLAIDGEPVTAYSCDGLIVATPVGSTAHSLAAGGPILRQDLPAFVITPICPHTLTMRPLVDSADCTYTLTVPHIPAGAFLVVDGQIKVPLLPGDRVDIRRAPVEMQVAKVPGNSYYSTLHHKLGWGGQPNYRRP
jgi:NAD+ kinase